MTTKKSKNKYGTEQVKIKGLDAFSQMGPVWVAIFFGENFLIVLYFMIL